MRIIVPVLALCVVTLGCRKAPDRFYATAEVGTKIIQIEVQGDRQITTKLIGSTGMPGVPLGGIVDTGDDEFSTPIYGFRPRILGRPPAAG